MVVPELIKLVNVLDILAIVVMLVVSWRSALILGLYIGLSRAYSNGDIRLKSNPITGTMVVAFMQGMGVFFIVQTAVEPEFMGFLQPHYFVPALGSTFLIFGSYPLTQVYQHEEDKKAGDNTLSLLLGVRGTFVWSGLMLLIGVSLLLASFLSYVGFLPTILLLISTQPATIYFLVWAISCWRNEKEASFTRAMWMNTLSSICLSLALGFLWWKGI